MATITADLPTSYLTSENTISSWLLTKDHKRIALLFFASITFFFFIGGIAATLIRMHLATPEGLLQPDIYNRMFTMHGIVMVWFFLIPSIPTTLGNFIIPLAIGAHDLAFPRINLASWYVFNLSGLVLLYALIMGGIDTGWTFYTPYSTLFANGYVIAATLAVFINGFSSIMTGLNFVVTIHRLRAPGMTWMRLPLFGYTGMTYALMSIAIISFFVWGHHMFTAGISIYSAVVFSLMTFFVAVPSAIKVFNWTASLHKGSITFDAPMLYALVFVLLFTIGGLTGLIVATVALDVHLQDTYFVIAHFHYIMVGGTVSAFFGGLHYWWPKISGRLYPEMWARMAALLTFVGFNLTFFPQFILGYLGMPRRYYAYPPEWQAWNVLSSAGASILAVAYILPLGYLGWSLLRGERAAPNPWRATGLEWQVPSPPSPYNFERTPVVP